MQKKWFFSLVFGIILSVVTMYLAFRNVPVSDLIAYIRTIRYIWLIPTVFLILLTFLLRVFRWQLILKGYQRVDFWDAFHPLMIGFMMNCILPGRVGEIARPTLLRQQRGIPITTGLTTVAAERLFDIFTLIILFVMVFGTIAQQPELEVSFGALRLNSEMLQSIAWNMIRLLIVLLIGLSLVIIPYTRRKFTAAINYSALCLGRFIPMLKSKSERVARFIITIIDNITAGLSLLKYPKRVLMCIVLTIAIWGLTLLSYVVFALGCPGISLSIMEWTTVMVVICFFIALPSAPGFWGLWEAGGLFALSLYGIAESDAVGFTLVNHAIQIIPVILIGWISALKTGSNILQLFAKQQPKGAMEIRSKV